MSMSPTSGRTLAAASSAAVPVSASHTSWPALASAVPSISRASSLSSTINTPTRTGGRTGGRTTVGWGYDARQAHGERGAATGALARGGDRAAVQFDECLHKREADAEPSVSAVKRTLALDEVFEKTQDN